MHFGVHERFVSPGGCRPGPAGESTVDEGKTAVKQATPLTVAMLISLEIFIVTGSNPLYARCLMWACLVCVWACMRVSDLQGIDVSRLCLFRDGLK